MDHQQKNDKTERARGLGRKKNKRGDRKGESNDSPEIPDRRLTSDIPGLPSGTIRDKCLEHLQESVSMHCGVLPLGASDYHKQLVPRPVVGHCRSSRAWRHFDLDGLP